MADRTALLRHPADRRTLGFAAAFFGLVALQWVAYPLPAVLALPLWGATAVLAFVGAVSTHNVIHSPMFSRSRLNDGWRLVQTLWYGQPVSLFVPVHNHSHHKHVQSRKDLTRSTKVDHRWQLINLLHGSSWQGAASRDVKLYFAAQAAEGGRIVRQFRAETAVLVAAYGALVLLDWRKFLVFVLLPHTFGTFAIRAINYLQHDGCAYDPHGYDHSRNFTGRAFNWLFLNNGFHTIHHMRPGLHWSVLPARHAELVAPHIHPALDVPRFLPWFWTHIVWPGRRQRYDGAAYEWPPGGEGPDEPWDFRVAANYEVDFVPGEGRARRAS
ncbi:MAG: fatty acid desaturase [Alphaproteobacteria bacterium]|nr:fatty acid desaturase [Alphaproteobacteria bacterium]